MWSLKGQGYMGNVKQQLGAKAIDSPANTTAEDTAKAEPNATDKTKKDVLGMSATTPCPKCHDEIKDDNLAEDFGIQTAKPSSDAEKKMNV